jgi:hypothetical protein
MPNKKLRYICFSFTLSWHFCLYAQDFFGSPQLLKTVPIEAPGVERVGAAPLPIENYTNIPLNRLAEEDLTERRRPFKKESFDTTYASSRILYLNGENINSVRNETLENVTVEIDDNGNIHIQGPQYEVKSEQSYHPLLPRELPKFKKDQIYDQLPINQGTYSKQTGQTVANPGQNSDYPPTMNKEIVPEINGSSNKVPPINTDGIKKNK